METTRNDGNQISDHDPLIERAAFDVFELATRVTETGQKVWEWRRGDEPRPQFVSERVALRWMREWLTRPPEARGRHDRAV